MSGLNAKEGPNLCRHIQYNVARAIVAWVALRKRSCHSVTEYSVMGKGAPFRLYTPDDMEANDLFPATITVACSVGCFQRVL